MVTKVKGSVSQDVERAASRAYMKGRDVPVGHQFSLEEGGRYGLFVVKSGTPPSDPQEGIYVVLDNGNYAERLWEGLHPRIEWWGGANINDSVPLAAMEDFLNQISIASIEDTTFRYNGNFLVGDEPMTLDAARRDVFQVARRLTGKTDCHAFSDKTVIDAPSDAGTYGTFDSTTRVEGAHSQSHQFSFQDRAVYAGTGDIQSWAGIIVWPEAPGSGTINNRYAMWVKDVDQQGGGGLLNNNFGIYIEDLNNGNSNVAINIQQSDGFGIFAPNGATNQFGGETHFLSEVGFGTQVPVAGLAATFTRGDVGDQKAFVSSNSVGGVLGVVGDNIFSVVTDAVNHLVCDDSSTNYAVRPGRGADTQPLGTAAFRWSEVYAVNGTINTSDAREKEQITEIDAIERKVATSLKGQIKKFKWRDSVKRKGDNARWHFGVIAQEVKEAFEKEGLNASEYGVLCFDEWDDVVGDDGEVQLAAGSRYGVRYDELFAFIISSI